MSDYLVEINKLDYSVMVVVFAVVCITAPVGGAVLSGYIGAWLGGPQANKSIEFLGVVMCILAASAVPIVLVSNNVIVITMLWIVYFLGGI